MTRTGSWRGKTARRRWTAACGGAVLLLAVCGCGSSAARREQANSAKTSVKAEAASARQVLASLKADLTDEEKPIPVIVNINYASQKELATLPGISMAQARTIMDNRPYNTPLDLLYKHVVTKPEYELIKGRVDAWDNLWATKN